MTDIGQADDPVAAVDALVATADLGLTSPGVESRDVVLVVGPWLAGATGVIAALRDRLPEHTFVEAHDVRAVDAPAAVVFVVSAVTPVTESDCALVDFAARHTDLVVGVVSKIDVHRGWRDVLAEDRTRLAAHAERYRDMPWVGVAAAPEASLSWRDITACKRDSQARSLFRRLTSALWSRDRSISTSSSTFGSPRSGAAATPTHGMSR
ncbi:hypothetical protein A5662_08610 [Mycobacteriaceae bacterium 1482268.1]|nr:hypothetical protein A5662_08610 [Mycobacteriaceae bacterium 1482268.1]